MARDATGRGPIVIDRPWHATSTAETLTALGGDPHRGLDEDEVRRREGIFGANDLPEPRRDTVLRIVLRQFKDPLIYILLAAGAVSLVIGNLQDFLFIFAVLAFNAGLGSAQEVRAESAAEALSQVIRVVATVTREGRRERIESHRLVPGDIVTVESGDSVPADLRLLEAIGLRVDESLLTGESVPTRKVPQAELAADTPLGDRSTLLHAGTTVVSGRGTGIVCRTGASTEVGRIAGGLAGIRQLPPLVLRMRRFTRVVAVAIMLVVVLLGAVQALRGDSLTDIFLLAVALAVSAIPAGLPVAITASLAIASHRMAEHHVIVRRLPAVEALGACTLIASDKTGTLTENLLTVRRLRPPTGDDIDVTGGARDLRGDLIHGGRPVDPEQQQWLTQLVISGALCNEAQVTTDHTEVSATGDSVDIAFLILARKLGIGRSQLLADHPEVGRIPFEPERRYAAAFHDDDGRVIAHVKGAPEAIAAMCDVDREMVAARADGLAAAGYRVLALASGEVPGHAAAELDGANLTGLHFLGLAGLIDPVRREVPGAVRTCQAAGVDVRMVTGDHPATALAISRQLGFAADPDEVVTGSEISASDTPERAIRGARVYARVEPNQKTEIVGALQDAGHFVAVTGDGVNDAPALRAAHVGVAMGASGTDVARDAADLVLTDDNFASIVEGIRQGRIAFANVRKVVWLLISTGVAELVLFMLSVAFDTDLPLTPVQLLWLNLVTNGIQDVALAFERGEPDMLDHPPRPPDEPIFNRLMIEQVATSGIYMGLVAFAAFYLFTAVQGMALFDARNLLLLLLVLFENVHVFNVRSETRSLFRVPLAGNRLLITAVIIAQTVHVASMFVPGWRDVLGVAPVSLGSWALLLLVALSLVAVAELYKHVRGRPLVRRADRAPSGPSSPHPPEPRAVTG